MSAQPNMSCEAVRGRNPARLLGRTLLSIHEAWNETRSGTGIEERGRPAATPGLLAGAASAFLRRAGAELSSARHCSSVKTANGGLVRVPR